MIVIIQKQKDLYWGGYVKFLEMDTDGDYHPQIHLNEFLLLGISSNHLNLCFT